jgi:hypothetical protein
MHPQTKQSFTRTGVRVSERVEIEMELHGEDRQQFKADPGGYVKGALEAQGYAVRELSTDGLTDAIREDASGQGPIRFLWARYHIEWDRDCPECVCMWTP